MSYDSTPILSLEKRVDAAIKCTRGNCIRITITEAEVKAINVDSPLVERLNSEGFYVATNRELTKGTHSLVLKRTLPVPISNRILEFCPYLLNFLML